MTIRKPLTPGAVDVPDPNSNQPAPEYLRSATGRVFKATPELIKQYRKNKFGLAAISEGEYERAMAIQEPSAPKSTEDAEAVAKLEDENTALKEKIAAMEAEAAKAAAPAKKGGRPPKATTEATE